MIERKAPLRIEVSFMIVVVFDALQPEVTKLDFENVVKEQHRMNPSTAVHLVITLWDWAISDVDLTSVHPMPDSELLVFCGYPFFIKWRATSF